ncbi:hypothetical protein QCA50_020074 [Cerrena zonata]|uniref:Uncharacterized protein n=1 Tax=Cerrena zonata TaxID=2478898 RepID=A0AAW0FA34_9APHY
MLDKAEIELTMNDGNQENRIALLTELIFIRTIRNSNSPPPLNFIADTAHIRPVQDDPMRAGGFLFWMTVMA